MTKTTNKRYMYIDLAKGLTMMTILWGHVMLGGFSNIIVYAFHIPVFFFLSGMVFRIEKYPLFSEFLKRRVKTLLIPYMIFSAITWVWWIVDCLVNGTSIDGSIRALAQTFIAQGSAGYMIHNPALWFVTCLFVVELLYYFICKLSDKMNILVCMALAVCGWLMMQPNGFLDFKALPWNIEVACAAVLFYSLGNLFSQKCSSYEVLATVRRKPYMVLGLIVASFIVLCVGGYLNGSVTMAQGVLGNNGFIFYINAVIGIIFVITSCLLLESIYGKMKMLDRVLDYFTWVGRNSFYMMVLHIPVMRICVKIVSVLSGQDINELRYMYQYTFPAWIGMVVGSSMLILIIKKHS